VLTNVRFRLNRPPKLVLAGTIILLISSLIVIIDVNIGRSDIGILGIYGWIIGIVLLFLSLKKSTRRKIVRTLEPCECCKCTNCGLRHNHWTHD